MPTKKQTRKLPSLSARAQFKPETLNADERTVEMVISTDNPARMYRWDGWDIEEFNEILDMDTKSIRMGRLQSGAPLLNNHKQWDLSSQIGVIDKAWTQDGELRGLMRFSRRPDVEPFFQDVKDGIIRNVSVGYRVYKYADETASDDKIKTLRAIDWEPFEASLVCVPADPDANVRQMRASENQANEVELISEVQDQDDNPIGNQIPEELVVTPEEIAAQEEKRKLEIKAAEEKARAMARADEKVRQTAIRKAVQAAKLGETFAQKLIDEDHSLDQARALVIDELANKDAAQPITRGTGTGIEIGRDEKQTRQEAMAEALLHRHDPRMYKITELGMDYRGMSLLRLAEEIIGQTARRMAPSELALRVLSTADFPNVFANVLNKVLRDSYSVAPKTFEKLVKYGMLRDYKPGSRVQLGDVNDLQPVNENGEYQWSKIGDAAESIQLAKMGRKVRLTEEMIVNDDLNAFSRLPMMAGNAAARAESQAVYGILNNNPNMADGNALFSTAHVNKAGSGTTITAGLTAAMAAMKNQKTLDGGDFLGVLPKFLVCGTAKETEAKQVLNIGFYPTSQANINVWKDYLSDVIVDPRLTGNNWFLFADPTTIDTIELAYLEGMNGPQVDMIPKLEDDSVIYKVKHVFAAKAIDYRGMYFNAGA